jgi:hypothetical protein
MAKRENTSAIRRWGLTLAALWSCRYILVPVLAPCVMSGEVYIMVSTVPTEFVVSDIVTCAVAAVIVCFFVFLWRYVEHNDAEHLNRKLNPMAFKFIGGVALAMVLTGILAYFASSLLVGYFKVVEPTVYDYCVFGALAALGLGMVFTILFSEGITALGKFVEQKVREAKDAIDGITKAAEELGMTPEEYAAAVKEIAAAKKAEEPPKEA